MIPKILHQVWLGSCPIPEKFITWRDEWRVLHPDWEYMLHTDDDIPDDLKGYIDSCKGYSSKSNILRLYVVFKWGGVYCDTDFEWNKNIDSFLNDKFIVAKQHGQFYCNAFFGSVKGDQIIKFQLDLLPKYVTKSPPWGPELMTIAVEKHKDDVKIIPTKYVYPYMWFQPYKPAREFPEAYLVHHWEKSWQ